MNRALPVIMSLRDLDELTALRKAAAVTPARVRHTMITCGLLCGAVGMFVGSVIGVLL